MSFDEARSHPLDEVYLPDPTGGEPGWRELTLPRDAHLDASLGLDRAARHPQILGAPTDSQQRLRQLDVTLIGAGGVGLRFGDSLARMGVGTLRFCDSRRTKATSLLTHSVRIDEIGVKKARLAARRAKEISPETRVFYFDEPFEHLPADALFDSTHVLLATDQLSAEVAVGQACLHLGRPLIQASVYGPALIAQARWFAADQNAAAACPACGYTRHEWDALDRGTRYSCEAAPGGASAAPEPTGVPTASFPHLCSTAANLAVDMLLRDCLELGTRVASAEVAEYCGFSGESTRTPLDRNPDCPLEHSRWTVCTSDLPPHTLSPRDLARIAGYADRDLQRISFRVEHHRFATLSACACAGHGSLGRFVHEGETLSDCARCGRARVLHPLHSHADVPGGAIVRCLDRPLRALGVKSTARTVLVRGPKGTTLVRRAPIEEACQP